jgi:hypothetical protein
LAGGVSRGGGEVSVGGLRVTSVAVGRGGVGVGGRGVDVGVLVFLGTEEGVGVSVGVDAPGKPGKLQARDARSKALKIRGTRRFIGSPSGGRRGKPPAVIIPREEIYLTGG